MTNQHIVVILFKLDLSIIKYKITFMPNKFNMQASICYIGIKSH